MSIADTMSDRTVPDTVLRERGQLLLSSALPPTQR